MGFIEATGTCIRKGMTLSGRAGRAEFWWFFLAQELMGFGLRIVLSMAAVLGISNRVLSMMVGNANTVGLFVATLAAGWRRLHDIGRSGWWMVLPFVVPVGLLTAGDFVMSGVLFVTGALLCIPVAMYLVVLLASPGDDGPNRFGDDPRQPEDLGKVFA